MINAPWEEGASSIKSGIVSYEFTVRNTAIWRIQVREVRFYVSDFHGFDGSFFEIATPWQFQKMNHQNHEIQYC